MQYEWENCGSPRLLIRRWAKRTGIALNKQSFFATGKASLERKGRLLILACCHHICRAKMDALSEEILQKAEKSRYGLVGQRGKKPIREKWNRHLLSGQPRALIRALEEPLSCGLGHLRHEVGRAAFDAAVENQRTVAFQAKEQERIAQCHFVREIFANPFKAIRLEPEWLTWNYSAVFRIAETIAREGCFEDVAILGDALEDAGCDDPTILDHCRGSGPHVEGCWLLDFILGHDDPTRYWRHIRPLKLQEG